MNLPPLVIGALARILRMNLIFEPRKLKDTALAFRTLGTVIPQRDQAVGRAKTPRAASSFLI
jgi:hypothetical protein